jgi:hypothetical protein
LVASFVIAWYGISSAQIRQDKLVIDDGSGQFLELRKATGGSAWTFTFPSNSGTSGEVLTFGSGGSAQWSSVNALLPSQSGNAGLFLKTDGSTLSWASPSAASSPWSSTSGKIYPTTLTDRVGIGISTPQNALHVDGSASNAYAQFTNSSTGSSVNDGLSIGVTSSGAGRLSYGENNYFSMIMSGTTALEMDPSGRVAVGGLPDPSYTFLAYGADPSVGVNSNGVTIGDVFGNAFANYFYVDFEATPRFLFMGANIGVGTPAPSEQLDIASGNVRISGANDYKYSTAKTHYYAVPAAAFELENSSVCDRAMIGGNIYTTGGSIATVAYFVAPVHLPDGATVTSVTYYVVDNDGTYNLQNGQLYRNDGSTSTSYGNQITMATIPTPASTNSSLIQTSTTSTITTPVIDNQNYMYWLRWGTQQNDPNLRLCKVVISYTVTKVD